MTKIILIIAYVSAVGLPKIEVIERAGYNECRREATAIFNQVKSGTVRAWCVKIPK